MDVYFTLHGVTFAWDARKAGDNLRKHGVSFEEACEAFFDPFVRPADAGRHDEERLAFLGMTEGGRLLFVVYTGLEDDVFRIISARRATRQERRAYESP